MTLLYRGNSRLPHFEVSVKMIYNEEDADG